MCVCMCGPHFGGNLCGVCVTRTKEAINFGIYLYVFYKSKCSLGSTFFLLFLEMRGVNAVGGFFFDMHAVNLFLLLFICCHEILYASLLLK